eukprot:g45939.t1
MRLREFFDKPQDVSSKPIERTNKPEQLTEGSMVQQPQKKELNWNPLEGRCLRLDISAQEVRRCVNIRFISRTHKVQNITQAQRNAIRTLKTNCNIVIKPADKGGTIVIQNRTDHSLCTSVPHNDGITATASVLNTTNSQFPDILLQLIHFILDHNVFTFENQFFIQIYTPICQYFHAQTIACGKLPSLQDNVDHNTTQPCHGNVCKTCQIIDLDTTITRGSNAHHVHSRYSCDLANIAYLI